MNKKHIFSLFVTALICILAFCAPASFASDGELVAVYKTTGEYGFAKYGFADKNGKLCIDYIYDYAKDFKNGLAFVSKNGKAFFINSYGAVAFRSNTSAYTYIESFSDSRALVRYNKKYGFIKYNRQACYKYRIRRCSKLQRRACGSLQNEKYGFIDTNGNVVIDFLYDDASSFKNGSARIKLNGRYGFINAKGEKMTAIMYDRAARFSEDRCVVKINKKCGVINKKGFFIVPLEYDWISDFEGGIATAGKNELFGYIDSDGNEITSIKYLTLNRPEDGYIICSVPARFSSELFGVINKSENTVIPFAYDEITYIGKDMFIVRAHGGKTGVINSKNRIMLGLKYDKITKDGDILTAENKNGIQSFNINELTIIK